MKNCIVIRGLGFISCLGCSEVEFVAGLSSSKASPTVIDSAKGLHAIFALQPEQEDSLKQFVAERPLLTRLDRSVQFAAFAAERAFGNASWNGKNGDPVGIFIGSSRGATASLESAFAGFLAEGSVSNPRTSPLTTLGNVSSTVGQLLKLNGVHCSHSITCSTALHGVLHAIAWLKAGMIKKAIVGGSEASLTAFTIAQMQALGIYSALTDDPWPCRPFAQDAKENTFVLGEGAACFALESVEVADLQSDDIVISGYGFATEQIKSLTAMSAEGLVLQETMNQAAKGLEIDCIVTHAPGTLKGDRAEYQAIQATFAKVPIIASNKMHIGHTFAASGAFNLLHAIAVLRGGVVPRFEYPTSFERGAKLNQRLQRLLVNASGFGGNAVSLVIQRGL